VGEIVYKERGMKFKKVDKNSINTLYALNKKLAKKEKQKDLFIASKKESFCLC
jgi:hypothetical protein